MTALPPSTDFTGSNVTEGGFKTAITSLRTFIADLLGTDSGDKAAARAALGAMQQVLTTRGDIVSAGASGVPQRLALGTNGQVLKSDGTDAVWGDAAGVAASQITASLGGNVSLNNASNYFDGPSVAQGSTGTWFVSGTVTLNDTGGAATFYCKLWDGTTVIASCVARSLAANNRTNASLSGYIASPAGNLRISVKDISDTTGAIQSNASGEGKDSTISAYRIG